jgi:vitamin B12 transporter
LLRDDSFDDPGNFTKLDGFTVVDFSSEYLFNPNWAFGLNVNNIFDEENETAAYYNQYGINGRITLRYVPNQ